MRRLPLVLSATALVVAVFGSTPVGHAVGSAIPAFAKSAGYAKQAGNASALNGIKASKQPRAGMLRAPRSRRTVPCDRRHGRPRRPEGRQRRQGSHRPGRACRCEGRHRTGGPIGEAGPRGSSGLSGWEFATGADSTVAPKKVAGHIALCSGQKKPLGGGVASTVPNLITTRILESAPDVDRRGWWAYVYNEGSVTRSYYTWAICAKVD